MDSGDGAGRVRLVIIDSIAGPISPILGGGPTFQGHSLMIETATILKHIAARHSFAVLVTNHMSAGQQQLPPADKYSLLPQLKG